MNGDGSNTGVMAQCFHFADQYCQQQIMAPQYNFFRLDDGVELSHGQRKPTNYGIFTPQLYLELIENKSKLRRELIGKPYTCPSNSLDFAAEQEQNQTQLEEYDSAAGTMQVDELQDDEQQQQDQQEQQQEHQHQNEEHQPLFKFDKNQVKRLTGRLTGGSRQYGRALNPNERKQMALAELFSLKGKDSELSNIAAIKQHVPQSLNQLRQVEAAKRNEEDDEKRKLISKINLFRSVNPECNLPDFSMSTDAAYMREQYQKELRNVKISEKHLFFRKLLGGYFIIVELFCGKMLKMDIKGFAEMQMQNNMKTYDKYLLEICHKRYLPDAPESISVEWRLFGAIMLNTVGFVVVFKLLGKNAAVMSQGLLGSLNVEQIVDIAQNFGNSQKSQPQFKTQPIVTGIEPIMSGPKKRDVPTNGEAK